MTSDQNAALIRSLKGAPASILWILHLSGRTLTAVQLQHATGYSDKPISRALTRLKALGLVQHHGRSRGWSITTANWPQITGITRQQESQEAPTNQKREYPIFCVNP